MWVILGTLHAWGRGGGGKLDELLFSPSEKWHRLQSASLEEHFCLLLATGYSFIKSTQVKELIWEHLDLKESS